VLTIAVLSMIALAAIWLVYPAVIWILSLFRRQEPSFDAPLTSHISVIIATRDSADRIAERIADALAGGWPAAALEVVVGLDESGGVDPASLAGAGPRVRVVRGPRGTGKAGALNAAVAASSGEVLVFTDVAQRFAPLALERLVRAIAGDRRLGAVSGALHIGRDGRPRGLAERYWAAERWLRACEARLHSTVGVTGAIYAMPRAAWHPLPAGVILDDVYGPMHLVLRGYRVGFCPTAVAWDDRRFDAAQEYRRKVRTLTGVVQLCAWLPEVLLPWRNPIWLQFLFHKLLRLATPWLLLGVVLGLAGWLGAGGAGLPAAAGRLLLAGGAALVVAGLATSPRLRRGVAMSAAMQAAAFRATINGFRGHWDVWTR
jgi:cellulose synthase/poly-beta-1,6-N-acetylglucosamine synthase-like glycosyltransferase